MRATAQQPQRAPNGARPTTNANAPQQFTLHCLVQHAVSFIVHTEASTGAELRRFIKDGFDVFLHCGILARGFRWLRCDKCGHDKLLAFSVKRRGFCPSWRAAHVVDRGAPRRPRHTTWVLSLPIPLRLLMAAQLKLVTPVLQVVQRFISIRRGPTARSG